MRIIDEYLSRNQASLEAYENARRLMPSGNTRSALYWQPFPLCMRRGEGSHIWDVDGNKRVDFNYNNTTLILGHNHPKVIEAVTEQLTRGTVLGASTETEPRLAEEILGRLGSADRIRFTPTGTEANMQALRVARAYTGKPLIAKCLGGYHGSWDAVPTTPDAVDIPQPVKDNTVYFPYNDPEEAEALVKKHKDELAAMVVEPTMRDMTPRPEFLETLREVTADNDVLLVFDEVISFRLGYRGAQGYYGVSPDMTAIGKIIGGGFPVGAYASTDECMGPLQIPDATLPEVASPRLGFSGTFNAHPLAMTAGLTVMREMKPERYDDLAVMGEMMRMGLRKAFIEEGVRPFVGGAGSLFFVSWTDKEVIDHESSLTADRGLFNIFNLGMMNRGVFILGHPNVSVVQRREDIRAAVEAARETVREMKPLIRERAPNLRS
ncbi:MAG: aspartate aminotransferase family protein [Candidatus Bathyarchaeota archaeon]|nr:aspartate aminotransferase family protein [Candidatus Bathyarchaeota archaeon]